MRKRERVALRTWVLVVCGVLASPAAATAQDVRFVTVGERQVRVRTAGLGASAASSPVVVLEAGFMYDGLSAWTALIDEMGDFAPVVAYDRAGVGESDPDGEVPTPGHVAENLRSLLNALDAPPPYLLVGHSLGGVFIRMFTALYPDEVAGLVYVDPSDWMRADVSSEYDRAMGISAEGRRRLNAATRATFRELPNASIRAEAEMMFDMSEAGWPDLQGLPSMPNVPVTVLMASRFEPQPSDAAGRDCEPRVCHDRRIAFRRSWLAALADEVPAGTLTVVNDSGHFIQNEDPALVVWAIRRTMEAEVPEVGVPLSDASLAGLVGEFENDAGTRVTIFLEHRQLFLRVGEQRGRPIAPRTESEFFLRGFDGAIRFDRTPAGDADRLLIEQGTSVVPYRRVR